MINPNELRTASISILKTDYDWRAYNKFNESAAKLAAALPELLEEMNKLHTEGVVLREVISTLKREKNLADIACEGAIKLREAACAELAEARKHIARLSATLATHDPGYGRELSATPSNIECDCPSYPCEHNPRGNDLAQSNPDGNPKP